MVKCASGETRRWNRVIADSPELPERASGPTSATDDPAGNAERREKSAAVLRALDRLDPERLPLKVEIAGRTVRVHYAREGMTAWAEDAEGNLLPGVLAYEWGWKRFHPEARSFPETGAR